MDDRSFNVRIPKRWVRVAMIVGVTALIVAPLTAIASHSFTDVPDSNIFHSDIEWLADAGVTKGCNPPANTEFCPKDNVTREAMSAFMHRFAKYIDAEDGTPAQADNASTADDADTLDGFDSGDFLQFDSTLQPGQTLTGTWGVAGNTSGWMSTAVNFIPHIDPSADITGHYLDPGDPFTADCPGFGEAAAGHFCMYAVSDLGSPGFAGFGDPYSGAGDITDVGTVLYLTTSGANDYARGNWAITAPAAGGSGGGADTGQVPIP